MTSDDVIDLTVMYTIIFLVVVFFGWLIQLDERQGSREKIVGSRAILAAPIWPLAMIGLLLFFLWKIPKFFINAYKEAGF